MGRLHEEDDEQAAFFEWLNWAHPNLAKKAFAIPNGGKRDPREAARFKRQGVKAGVSDIFIAHPVHVEQWIGWTNGDGKHTYSIRSFHGLWIELKRPVVTGRSVPLVTKDQRAWIDLMNENNYCAAVCYGWEEASQLVGGYLEFEERHKDAQ